MMSGGASSGILRRLRGDRRGLSAVEFALLAPIIILFYFCLAEFCQGYMAQKRMGHATSMVGDLVARTDTLNGTEVDDILAIGALIMKPFSASPLRQRVSSVVVDANMTARVDWVRGSAIPNKPLAKGSVVTLPAGVVSSPGDSVIMSEAIYDYDSPARYLMPSVTRFSHTYYLRPRTTDKVTLN